MNDLHKSSRKPVTIAIGMLGDDAILVAADSQSTRDNVKSTKAFKLDTVLMADAEILIAQAGHVDNASMVLQSLARKAKGTSLSCDDTFAKLIQDALFEVRSEMRRQHFNCSSEELDEHMYKEELSCHILAAHYFNGLPYIYHGNLVSGTAPKVAGGRNPEQYYATAGTGRDLASYLLDEYSKPGMSFNPAFATLIYTIGEVKKHDTYCSGLTRLGFIGSDNAAGLLQQEIVNDVAFQIEKFNELTREERNQKMFTMFDEVAKKVPLKYPPK